jgi:hypothetical protein
MQLTQDVVGQVLAGLGFTVDVNRHIGVFAAHLVDEGTQVDDRRVQIRPRGKFFVVDRQDEGAGAALLLGKLRQVTVAGHPQNLEALADDGIGQSADAQS